MKQKKGFTLIELLVVIIIIIILASTTVALLNIFFRGQGVRQGAMVVAQAFAQCKTLAADKRTMHFVVFTNQPDGGVMRIYQDTGTPPNKMYDAGDIEVQERAYPLPKYVMFNAPNCPAWVGIDSSGYVTFSPTNVGGGGFTPVQASVFEANVAGYAGGMAAVGCDIELRMQNQSYRTVMSIDKAAGKVRKVHFLAQ